MHIKKREFLLFWWNCWINKKSYEDILKIKGLYNEIHIERICVKNNYKIIKNNNCFYLSIKSDQDLSGTNKLIFFQNKINDEVLTKKKELLELLDKL